MQCVYVTINNLFVNPLMVSRMTSKFYFLFAVKFIEHMENKIVNGVDYTIYKKIKNFRIRDKRYVFVGGLLFIL